MWNVKISRIFQWSELKIKKNPQSGLEICYRFLLQTWKKKKERGNEREKKAWKTSTKDILKFKMITLTDNILIVLLPESNIISDPSYLIPIAQLIHSMRYASLLSKYRAHAWRGCKQVNQVNQTRKFDDGKRKWNMHQLFRREYLN